MTTHYKSSSCKNKYTSAFWTEVTCKKCLKNKPNDELLIHEDVARMRQTCNYEDEKHYVLVHALQLISKGAKNPDAIAYAALNGKMKDQ